MAWRLLLAAGSAGFALLAIEIALRGLVVPSPNSAGRVLGSELPPIRLIPSQPAMHQPRARRPGRIRRDDLAGMVREDPLLGYVPRERAISSNGWWQSNNVGARARHDTAAEPPPGTTRVLVFGDSFAGGSRVPQEQAWPAVLEASAPGLEVVNLGVDGYSVGQSLLRYRALRDDLHPGVVLLTVSPRADFWRDVNTLRALAGWRSWTVMPRFVLEDGELRLVPSPYPAPSVIYADNRDGSSARLRDHLARYDRFYVPWMYTEPAGLVGRSLLVRFLLARWHAVLQRRTHEGALAPDGEAVAVTTRIAVSMCAESAARGASFLLLLLPSERDLGHLRRRAAYREQWRAIAAAFTRAGVPSIDLAAELLAAPAEYLDRGYDGTHHGPRANSLIAAAAARALTTLDRGSAAACGGPAVPPGATSAPISSGQHVRPDVERHRSDRGRLPSASLAPGSATTASFAGKGTREPFASNGHPSPSGRLGTPTFGMAQSMQRRMQDTRAGCAKATASGIANRKRKHELIASARRLERC